MYELLTVIDISVVVIVIWLIYKLYVPILFVSGLSFSM